MRRQPHQTTCRGLGWRLPSVGGLATLALVLTSSTLHAQDEAPFAGWHADEYASVQTASFDAQCRAALPDSCSGDCHETQFVLAQGYRICVQHEESSDFDRFVLLRRGRVIRRYDSPSERGGSVFRFAELDGRPPVDLLEVMVGGGGSGILSHIVEGHVISASGPRRLFREVVVEEYWAPDEILIRSDSLLQFHDRAVDERSRFELEQLEDGIRWSTVRFPTVVVAETAVAKSREVRRCTSVGGRVRCRATELRPATVSDVDILATRTWYTTILLYEELLRRREQLARHGIHFAPSVVLEMQQQVDRSLASARHRASGGAPARAPR